MDRALKSCSKIVGERKNVEEMGPKKVKMRDLGSILRSEGFVNPREEEEEEVEEEEEQSSNNGDSSICLDLALNLGDNSDSTEHNPFKKCNQTRSNNRSECGSTTGSSKESESLRRWRQMKENGFISSSHGGIPLPKQRGRPSKRKKEEEPKKMDQINRFNNVTSPSGLLSGLNPGIINHVRNSKQVLSIIETLVKSEKAEKEEKGKENLDPSLNGLCCEDDSLELKLKPSKNVGISSTEIVPPTGSNRDFLSIKAASVASQWLELLHQDTRGRLAALKRSRKRLRCVLQRDLSALLSEEPLSSQENSSGFQLDPSSDSCAVHGSRWRALFDNMDMALSEEGKHLEQLLEQVREMQMKCEKGLELVKNELSTRDNSLFQNRFKQEIPLEGDYAVRAAAASLYSVCSFILTTNNVSCF